MAVRLHPTYTLQLAPMTPHGLDDAINGNVGVMRGIDNGELSAKEGDGSLDCSRRCDLRKLKNPPSVVDWCMSRTQTQRPLLCTEVPLYAAWCL